MTTLQSFKVIEIPRLVRGKPGSWDPSVCLSWGDRFLEFLKGVVSPSSSVASLSSASPHAQWEAEDEDTGGGDEDIKESKELPRVWRVVFKPGGGVSVRLLDKEEVEDVEGGEDRVGFLPRWFWDSAKQSRKEGSLGQAESLPQLAKTVVPPGWQL